MTKKDCISGDALVSTSYTNLKSKKCMSAQAQRFS